MRGSSAGKLAALADAFKEAAGAPQHIEGCFVGHQVYRLQSHAQV